MPLIKRRKVKLIKPGRNPNGKRWKPMDLKLDPKHFSGRGGADKPYKLTEYALERHRGKQLSGREAKRMAEESFERQLGNFNNPETADVGRIEPIYFVVEGVRASVKFTPDYEKIERMRQAAIKRRKEYRLNRDKRDAEGKKRNARA